MISKSGQISFKSIHINAKDINNETKSFVIDGNAIIECLTNKQGEDKFVLTANNETKVLNHIDTISEVNSNSDLYIRSLKPVNSSIKIDKIYKYSAVYLGGSVNVEANKCDGNLYLSDNSQAQIKKVDDGGKIDVSGKAKASIGTLNGVYSGCQESSSKIENLYSGSYIFLNDSMSLINRAELTINNYYSTNNTHPLYLSMRKNGLLTIKNNFNGRLNAFLANDSIIRMEKNMVSSVIPVSESRRVSNTSIINVQDQSQFEVKGNIEGNVDFNLSSDKPLKVYQNNLIASGHVDVDTKITQQGYSKSYINQFDGKIQLLNDSYSRINELSGTLDMSKKFIWKETDQINFVKYNNNKNQTNSSLADVEKIASTANINLTSNAILRYKEKDENAVINRTGLLNKGSYHQVKEFD